MTISLSEATKIGIQAYRDFGYSEGPVSILRMTSRRLQEYLNQQGLSYSAQEAQTWVESIPEKNSPIRWIRKKAVAMEKAICVLDEIFCYGKPVSSITPLSERIPAKKKISKDSLSMMEDYLNSVSGIYAPNTIRIMKDAVARFLLTMEQKNDIRCVSDINISQISEYFKTDMHASESNTKEYHHYVEGFLLFRADQGILPDLVLCTFHNYSPLLSPLVLQTEEAAESFHNISEHDSGLVYRISEYQEAGRALLKHYHENHYRIEYCRVIRSGLHAFEVFLRINGFSCSMHAALLWLSYLEAVCSHSSYNNIRRAVLAAFEILSQGTLHTKTFCSSEPKYPILKWQAELLEEYKIYRNRLVCAPSTWRTIHSACARFFVYEPARHGKTYGYNAWFPKRVSSAGKACICKEQEPLRFTAASVFGIPCIKGITAGLSPSRIILP